MGAMASLTGFELQRRAMTFKAAASEDWWAGVDMDAGRSGDCATLLYFSSDLWRYVEAVT